MIKIATRVLHKNPKYITFIAPMVTYTFTVLAGTGHVAYSVLPVIAEVSRKNGIRPERPLTMAVIASQFAIVASPIAAAVVACVSYLEPQHITMADVLKVSVPSTIIGIGIACVLVNRMGKELKDDPEYQRRMQDPVWRDRILSTTSTTLNEELPPAARNSVLLFILALVSIVVVAMLPAIRTIPGMEKPIDMSVIIQMFMLGFGGIILLATRTHVQTVPNGVVFKSGMVAAIAIFGIAWMSDTYFSFAMPHVKGSIQEMVKHAPWTFAFALFGVSVLINSQAATAKMLLPVGISLGIPAPVLIGLMPATYAYFFIPNYPSDIATVNFDVTGTTKIGKYYFNHSFMMPGLIGVGIACLVGLAIAKVIITPIAPAM